MEMTREAVLTIVDLVHFILRRMVRAAAESRAATDVHTASAAVVTAEEVEPSFRGPNVLLARNIETAVRETTVGNLVKRSMTQATDVIIKWTRGGHEGRARIVQQLCVSVVETTASQLSGLMVPLPAHCYRSLPILP